MCSKFGFHRILVGGQAFNLLLDKRHRDFAICVTCLIDRQVTIAVISKRTVAETVCVHVSNPAVSTACLPGDIMNLVIDLIVVNIVGLDSLEQDTKGHQA